MTHRIGFGTAAVMIGVAALVDGLQFLLTLTVVGSIAAFFLSIFSWTLFFIWFLLLGVNYLERGKATRMLIMLGSAIVELVPLINALPAVTLGVVALIVHSRIEDSKRANRTTDNGLNRKIDLRAADALRKSQLIEAARIAREARRQRSEGE